MATFERKPFPAELRKSRPDVLPTHFQSEKNVLVAFGFKCNLACRFCMVEDSLDVKEGVDLHTWKRLARDPRAVGEVERVVLSGGEATLEPELLEYVAVARSIPGVRHVRLQTNAMKLASPKFTATLIDAGVDEFFVSLHGADETACDAITQVPGSFRGIMRGIETIAASAGTLYTNTCIVSLNYEQLEDLVQLVAPHGPEGMDFWGLWPRLDPRDERKLHAPVADVQPHLLAALTRCEARGIHPVVKWYPRCLLGHHAHYQNDAQPTVLINNEYWEEAPSFSCLYENDCVWGRDKPCAGLSHAYVRRFGWEVDVLRPQSSQPQQRTHQEAGAKAEADRSSSGPAMSEVSADLTHWAESLGFRAGERYAGFTFAGAERATDGIRLIMKQEDRQFDIYLYARSEDRPCFGTSNSFCVVHSRVDADLEPLVGDVMTEVLAVLQEGDPGGRTLPSTPAPS